MLDYIKGALVMVSPTELVVEAGGLGYRLHISLHTYSRVQGQPQVLMLVHQHTNTQDMTQVLYGFADEEERELFRLLISVSGVGANTARLLLSSMAPAELRTAIVQGNEGALKSAKGIGLKTAQRIILELKDKVAKSGFDTIQVLIPAEHPAREEALYALVALGFAKPAVQKTLNQLLKNEPTAPHTTETLIKQALRLLAG